MDRLPTLIVTVLALAAACDKGSPAPPPSRVEGAQTGAKKQASTDAFCDVHVGDDSGAAVVFPALADGATVPATPPGHWRWLNVWATWCKPCIDELPRIVKWREQLAKAGKPIDLTFVSIDDSDADIAAFRKLHTDAPESLRIADPTKQTAWFGQLGLDAASPIPLHVFVSPGGHIRCSRAGGVREQDFAAIERLISE